MSPPSNVTMFRIAWMVKATGVTGHGQYCFTQEKAVAYATAMDIQCPTVTHWIQPEPNYEDVCMCNRN